MANVIYDFVGVMPYVQHLTSGLASEFSGSTGTTSEAPT